MEFDWDGLRAQWERQHERRENLAPFMEQAKREASAEIGKAPLPPKQEEFNLTPSILLKAPKKRHLANWSEYSSAETFWAILVPTGVGLWATASAFPALYNSGWLGLGAAGVAIFFGVKIFIAPRILAWVAQNEKEQWIREHPDWQRFVNATAIHTEELKEYENRKTAIAEAKAELAFRIAKQNESVWRIVSGVQFEKALASLFELMGYQVELTPYTGDGGVDIKVRKDGKLTVVQCKAHKTKVSISTARELRAAIMDMGAHDGIIACFEGVTGPVSEYIKERSISVMTLPEIITLQRKHQ